ncbi:cadmium-induced protein AS8 [Ipomoea triloba]|uniref:cadmium-induced protein AS8 n=1 Tax=Ipomoea triloba TaxID=35885 RepID=UPI00125E33E3|nr:cadmium-induced protein AS8 [Ipomoea triloba]
MIIKGVFRRYERWNPVHPTYGAFWGIGIGIGCGVGWGPGFGPEVIGYVGAGCGAGFSVGITLAGIGIGLPANDFFTAPYNAFMATRSGALDVARSSGLLSIRNDGREGWFNLDPQISGLQQKIGGAFSTLTVKGSLKNAIDFSDLKTQSVLLTKGFLDQMKTISKHESKGSEDE